MRNHFKKYALLLIAGLVICSMSCEKDSKGGGEGGFIINARNIIIDGNDSNIAAVKAIMWNRQSGEDEPIATGTYENGRFKLTLPNTIDDCYLDKASNLGGRWRYISNPNVKMGEICYISAYNEADNEIGSFGYFESRDTSATYVYADRSVTITGSYDGREGIFIYDCSLKKGWNVVYYISWGEDEDEDYRYHTLTTKKPSNITLKWHYHGWGKSSATKK